MSFLKRFSLACLLGFAVFHPSASAATVLQTFTFDPSRRIVDRSRDQGLDFRWVFSLDASGVLQNAWLRLTHFGNLNEGPRREIWQVEGPIREPLGFLSRSAEKVLTDEWQITAFLLPYLDASGPWSFAIHLSERTAFSSESLDLSAVELELLYRPQSPRGSSPVSVPETAAIGYFLLALGISAVFRRYAARK